MSKQKNIVARFLTLFTSMVNDVKVELKNVITTDKRILDIRDDNSVVEVLADGTESVLPDGTYELESGKSITIEKGFVVEPVAVADVQDENQVESVDVIVEDQNKIENDQLKAINEELTKQVADLQAKIDELVKAKDTVSAKLAEQMKPTDKPISVVTQTKNNNNDIASRALKASKSIIK